MPNDENEALEGLDLSGLGGPDESAGPGSPEALEVPPLIINWRELANGEARGVWEELRSWVTWACDRYDINDKVVPACWWKHPYLVEELSALFASWMAFYDVADTGVGPISWLERLANAKPRMRDSYGGACAREHKDPPVRTWPKDAEGEWNSWITTTHARG